MEALFTTHNADTEYNERNGEKVEVIRPLTKEEADIDDVGNMFRIRFSDGKETDAFEDELVLLDKDTDNMTRGELLDEAVRLLRTVNVYGTAEEQRIFFDDNCTNKDLIEYIEDIKENGFQSMSDEEREEMWEKLAEEEAREAADFARSHGYGEEYTSATNRDYGPSNPWDAPGMSVKDFI